MTPGDKQATNRKEKAQKNQLQMSESTEGSILVQHPNPGEWVTALDASPDGTWLATGGLGWETVYVWNMATKAVAATFEPDLDTGYSEGGVWQVAFHRSLPYLGYVNGQESLLP